MLAVFLSISNRVARRSWAEILDTDIIPVLRKQKGFQDELVFVAPNSADAVGISMWDSKQNAEAYARGAYGGVLKTLEPSVIATSDVKTYEVATSTFHTLADRAAV